MSGPTSDDSNDTGQTTWTEGEAPRDVSAKRRSAPPAEREPIEFDGYRLLERIGEGGMGDVWLAQQVEPVRRKVAVKIIKPGMDSRAIIGRFEAEYQALALMDHPCVAKVHDAGQTPRGRPYFVMEHVRGEPITTYCDRHCLGTNERLELFIDVCAGVQHAHHKGVIHRDLKPSNILVTIGDGDKVRPKIIDFGVAKAINEPLTEHTVHTGLGRIIGTPEYMSPEQAEMTGLDIDTRSDVYSLGVVLYELIAGAQPYDKGSLRSLGPAGLQRKIRDHTPPKPSDRYASLAEDSDTIAERRSTEAKTLQRRLSGDLDWITMMALEKDRTRRYDSPSHLAADIRRHLGNEAVLARPPSAAYQLRKLIARHRVTFAALVIVLATLVTGIVVSSSLYLRAERARAEVERERDRAEEVTAFLTSIFETSDPDETRGATITAQEILDRGAARLATELDDKPQTRYALYETIGRVYSRMGLYEQARPLLEEALQYRESLPGDALALANAQFALARLSNRLGDYERAYELASASLALREAELGPDDPLVADSLNAVGNAHSNSGRLEEATKAHERALDIRERALGPNDISLAQSLHNLGNLHMMADRIAESEALFLRALEIEGNTKGRDTFDYATTLHGIAYIQRTLGRHEDALQTEREALAIRQRVLGPDHAHTALSLHHAALLHINLGEFAEAVPMARQAFDIAETVWDESNYQHDWMLRTYGRALTGNGDYDRAIAVLERAVAIGRRTQMPTLAYNITLLGEALGASGDVDAAERRIREAIDMARAADPDDWLSIALAKAALGRLAEQRNDAVSALEHYRTALESMQELSEHDVDRVRVEQRIAALEAGR